MIGAGADVDASGSTEHIVDPVGALPFLIEALNYNRLASF